MENLEWEKELKWQSKIADLKKFLTEYLGLKNSEDADRIKFIRADSLEAEYKNQYDFLQDPRLAEFAITVVPNDIWEAWGKGQPSESHAELGMVLIRDDYFRGTDEVAWLTHEFGHCQRLLDTSVEQYSKDSHQPAFPEIGSEYDYPNNKVEQQAFERQFRYLTEKRNISKEEIIKKLLEYGYTEKDKTFFERI